MIYLAIILFIFLSGLSAWEEMQQLVQRGSWLQIDYHSFLFWTTEHNSIWKNFDSHHLSYGLFILVMFGFIYLINRLKYKFKWWMIPIAWYLFFHLRNIFMHIAFKVDPIWAYLWKM